MNSSMKSDSIVEAILWLGVILALAWTGSAGGFLYGAVTQEHSTYSIVAMDPATGDVGIAGASCVPISAGAMTTLVPGKGAAATQAGFTPWNQAKVFELLRQGATANEIIAFMRGDSYDSATGVRQYGVVTLSSRIVRAAGFTGGENSAWAGDLQDVAMAVSVQGNTLQNATVVSDALAAYTARDIGAVALPDRLLRALEAASAAGGDRRCNQGDVRQTAEAAFIAVARADQPPFAATLGQDPAPGDPATPWLYISVIEAPGGPNPLLELRSRYDTWRSENLPPCADCSLKPIPVPAGGGPQPLVKAALQIVSRVGLTGAGLSCLVSVALLVLATGVIYVRRRNRRPDERRRESHSQQGG